MFPPLIDVVHEARLNLAIYHLRQGELNVCLHVSGFELVETSTVSFTKVT